MHEVRYAGGTFVTSDEVAEALLSFAAALANADRAATLEVPAVGADGPEIVQVLVGPSSQIVAVPVAQEGPSLDVAAFLDQVREATRHHEAPPPLPPAGSSLDWDV